VNFTALASRFQITCCNRSASPGTRGAAVGCDVEAHAPGLRRRHHRGGRIVDHRRQIDLLDVQLQLAGDDPRDVEDVLDNLGQRLGVAFQDFDRARLLGAVGKNAAAQHAGVAENRIQRRPELVGQRAQETGP
jgi:hypothetical protein